MLVFDFDGVLLDSLDEVLVNCFWDVTSEQRWSIEALPDRYVSLFRRNRYHVGPAGDLLTLAAWCLRPEIPADALLSDGQWEKVRTAATEPVAARTARFFASRKALVESNRAQWLALNRPFEPLWSALRPHAGEVLVLTNKNRRAVLDLFDHFAMPIGSDQIFSGDNGATKSSNMREIMQRFPAPQYHFIEDSLHNLKEIQQSFPGAPIRLSLATWGYIGSADIAQARQQQFGVLTQQELVALLTPSEGVDRAN